jgi:subfamily B ATP-binding cassette protein MsbA
MFVILLIKDFLSGAIGGGGEGVAGWLTGAVGAEPSLWIVAALLVTAYVGGSMLNYDNQVTQQRIVKVLELGMMDKLIRHLLSMSVPFFDKQSHGDIIQAVRQDVSNLRIVVISIANLLLEGLLAVALAAAAFWLSPTLFLWALVVLPLALLPIVLVARKTLRQSYNVRRTGYVLFDVILQILRGIRIIKVYGGERREAKSAIRKGRQYFDELIEMVRVRSLALVALESAAGLSIVLVVVVGGLQVVGGTLQWPALLAFLMAVRALHGPLNNLNTNYMQIQNFGASVDRISRLLDARPEMADRPSALPLASAPRKIHVQDVGFAYDDEVVLEDISFELQSGETFGIVGPSGVGKTTLLNLIARFYDPSAGQILVDGRDLREYRLAEVYEKLALVTQTPFLFDMTVGDNIRIGRPSATDEEVEEAARAAEVHDEILAFPDGYDTIVGIGEHGLSGGQAQRINVARAILKNAPILLLDEATSSLDSIAETRVQTAIDRLMRGRTTIVVAHRLSTLRNADRLLILEDGRMAGLGSHDELLEGCALYRRMWEAQSFGRSPKPAGLPQRPAPVPEPGSDDPQAVGLLEEEATDGYWRE